MTGNGPIEPRVTLCPATFPTHPDRPCTEWVQEFDKQARTVAGGGAVAGRLSSGGMASARSISERAAESLRGVHRCCCLTGHVAEHGTPHMCGCRFEWFDVGPVAPPPPEAGGPA
jgi:hypothetical protein